MRSSSRNDEADPGHGPGAGARQAAPVSAPSPGAFYHQVVSIPLVDQSPTTAPAIDRLGRPLHDLRISVTDRCNFRCTYCMPREVFGRDFRFLPQADLLTFEEITRLARLFVELGVRKVRLTGGEPLLRRDVERLVAMLADVEASRT